LSADAGLWPGRSVSGPWGSAVVGERAGGAGPLLLTSVLRFVPLGSPAPMVGVRGEGTCGAAPVEDEGGHEDRLVCRDLVALTGMRRGEVAALLWDEVDFDNQRVYIRQTRSRIGTEMVVTSPKSGTGRLIDIDRDTTRRIVEHRERQTAATARLGLANPDRFVFLKPDFVPVRPDYLSERFLRISAHVGLPRIRFHDL